MLCNFVHRKRKVSSTVIPERSTSFPILLAPEARRVPAVNGAAVTFPWPIRPPEDVELAATRDVDPDTDNAADVEVDVRFGAEEFEYIMEDADRYDEDGLDATNGDPVMTASAATDVEDVTLKDAAPVFGRDSEDVASGEVEVDIGTDADDEEVDTVLLEVIVDRIEVDFETDDDDKELDSVLPEATADGGEVLLTSRVYKDSSAASC